MANIIRSLKSVRSELSKGKKVSCPDNPEASRKARKFDFIMLLTYLPYNTSFAQFLVHHNNPKISKASWTHEPKIKSESERAASRNQLRGHKY